MIDIQQAVAEQMNRIRSEYPELDELLNSETGGSPQNEPS
jgi:hypothetical protein